jgi:hypothetical protein
MDAAGNLGALAHRGRESANEAFAAIREQFLTEKVQAYLPFN